MKKILEIKDKIWLAGYALHNSLGYGGRFARLTLCNPFETTGVAQPSYNEIQVGLLAWISAPDTIRSLTNVYDGTSSYLLGLSKTKLYKILNASPYTISDVSANVAINNPSGRDATAGSIFWAGKYIFQTQTSGGTPSLRSWDLISGSDVEILSSGNWDFTKFYNVPFCIGADGNLYRGDLGQIGECTINTGSGPNDIGAARKIDNDLIVRDMVNDGRYLVVLADNNAQDTPTSKGKFKCRIYFWDMVKTQLSGTKISPDIIFDLPDESYFIGARILDGMIYAWGSNGLYEFNSGTEPKLIRPFIGSSALNITGKPGSTYNLATQSGSVLWGNSTMVGDSTYAYGNPIAGQQKIFYQPYGSAFSAITGVSAMVSCGNLLFLAFLSNVGGAGISVQNDSGANGRNGLIVQPISESLEQPYRFEYTKVVLTKPLSVGGLLNHQMLTQNGTVVSASETKSYSPTLPRQTFVFKRNAVGATAHRVEDLYPIVTLNDSAGGAGIARITVYGTPLDDSSEDF